MTKLVSINRTNRKIHWYYFRFHSKWILYGFPVPQFLAKCVNPKSINNKCLNLICQFDNCINARPDASPVLSI